MTTPVANAARIVAELRTRLKAEYGLEDGEDALEDTLEGETDLPEMLAMMARDSVQAADYSDAIKRRVLLMQERADRLSDRKDKLRAAVAWALQEAGWKRIPADVLPEFTATLSNGKRPLVIDNPDTVPDEYCRVKTTRELDKTRMREALERGITFPFVRFGNAQPVLTFRSK